MKALFSYLRRHLKEIRIIFLFVISTMAIILLFPREARFMFEFQKGNPWLHEEYIAPFNFPIYKSEERIAIERDSILKEFKPYFIFDSNIVSGQLERFGLIFEERWGSYLEEIGIDNERQIRRMEPVKENYAKFAG